MPQNNFTDPIFLDLLKRRDRAALEQFVEAYLPELLRAGRGMGLSVEDNEDLVQSTFIAMIEGVSRFEGRSHIRTFLYGIFYNKVKEHLREKWRAEDHDPIDEVMESRFDLKGRWRQPPVDMERQMFGQEARKMIQECLESIPPGQRAAFYFREVEEMQTNEICKKMGLTTTNLGVLLFRARNRLRECLEKRGLGRR